MMRNFFMNKAIILIGFMSSIRWLWLNASIIVMELLKIVTWIDCWYVGCQIANLINDICKNLHYIYANN